MIINKIPHNDETVGEEAVELCRIPKLRTLCAIGVVAVGLSLAGCLDDDDDDDDGNGGPPPNGDPSGAESIVPQALSGKLDFISEDDDEYDPDSWSGNEEIYFDRDHQKEIIGNEMVYIDLYDVVLDYLTELGDNEKLRNNACHNDDGSVEYNLNEDDKIGTLKFESCRVSDEEEDPEYLNGTVSLGSGEEKGDFNRAVDVTFKDDFSIEEDDVDIYVTGSFTVQTKYEDDKTKLKNGPHRIDIDSFASYALAEDEFFWTLHYTDSIWERGYDLGLDLDASPSVVSTNSMDFRFDGNFENFECVLDGNSIDAEAPQPCSGSNGIVNVDVEAKMPSGWDGPYDADGFPLNETEGWMEAIYEDEDKIEEDWGNDDWSRDEKYDDWNL
ncbi:hypothetical protein LRD18_08970 [Halorhodospira halochloris]|uniref:hypothetical protein n=1 Tax=Halorhodospira halochloris TaxID=1052 RepID=UPI001EE8A4F7|nr:hypothetical protein [Halorhodospira halochloris]MCG5531002.1 hypothetical protein [Halorhodospira halochloris]